MEIYNELIYFNTQVIEMYKAGFNKPMMLETNSLLSGWISDINRSCPPEDQFDITKEFITNEYAEFNSQN